MKQLILIFLLFSVSVLAQNVWYVNKGATGANTGRNWTDAWAYFDSGGYSGTGGINWNIIQGGDTIYIGAEDDSTTYYPELAPFPAYGLHIGESMNVGGNTTNWVTPENPVVIRPSWETGYNGEVWFVSNGYDPIYQIVNISDLSNIKFVNLNFYTDLDAQAVGVGSGYDTDSMLVFDNCYFGTIGKTGAIGISSTRITIENSIMEADSNEYPNDQDILTGSGGFGGHIFRNNEMHYRSTYVGIDSTLSANVAVVITDTSLRDTRISMVNNYHVNNSVSIGLYYLQITSNTSNTFYGDEWAFEELVGNDPDAVITDTSYYSTIATPSGMPENAYVGAVIHMGSDSMVITRSTQGTAALYGSGGWKPSTPAAGAFTITSNAFPQSGSEWTMGGAHRDFIQISATGDYNNYRDNVVANNLIFNHYEQGNLWNAMLYFVGQKNLRWLFYNNIIVNEKDFPMTTIWGRPATVTDLNSTQVLAAFNNTIITSKSSMYCNLDSAFFRNNLVVIDSAFNPQLANGIAAGTYLSWDYNVWARPGGFGNDDIFYRGSATPTWDEWVNTYGYDTHSDSMDTDEVIFTEKYGTDIADYYTTAGRDIGENLWDEYPFLRTDILGNARPENGTWDIGALEYGGSPPVSSGNAAKGSNGKLWKSSNGKIIKVQ